MAEEFRFKKRAAGPEYSKTDELTLWAHDDGTLRTTDEDGSVAEVGGGGGGSQPVSVNYFAFTEATPGLNNGVEFYTPQVGEVLLDAWFAVRTADVALALGDVGQFLSGDTFGFWGSKADQGAADLSLTDVAVGSGSFYVGPGSASQQQLSLCSSLSGTGLQIARMIGEFRTTDPLLLVVSANGQKGGAAATMTDLDARIYIATALPTALS